MNNILSMFALLHMQGIESVFPIKQLYLKKQLIKVF